MHGAYKNSVHLVSLYTYYRMMHGAYKNFVRLVGLYTYCRTMHGAYNFRLKLTIFSVLMSCILVGSHRRFEGTTY